MTLHAYETLGGKNLTEQKDADVVVWDSRRMEYKILADLIELRKIKGITQIDMAKKSGIKQQAISRIEKKENSPTLKTLCALADVLDVDIQLVPRHS